MLKNGAKPKSARKKRAVVTRRIVSKVAHCTKRGWTGAETAAKTGISVPTVQNIKKRLGLVKVRK